MLLVQNLSIAIKDSKREIVKDISFSVEDGETLGLIGESGSGKSMTSKCILGLLNKRTMRQQGSILWNGNEINTGIVGNEICMILQNPMTAFAPMLKIGRQMEMGFNLTASSARREFYSRLDVLFQKMSLPGTAKITGSYPHELSGGMLQRVMIAITLMKNPALLIADEITTAVDSASEYKILCELEDMKKRGISMLVVTHDFGVIARLCDKVAVMKNGRIIEQGKTQDVLKNPQNEYTKSLLSASMLFESREAAC